MNTARVEGSEKLLKALGELEPTVMKKGVARGLRKASKEYQQEIKSLAPRDTGFMESEIKVRAGKRKKGRQSVEVQLGGGFYKGDSFYGAFQEFGHHVGGRYLGNARTWVEGEHFFEEGFDNKTPQLQRELPLMIWDSVAEVAKKYGGK